MASTEPKQPPPSEEVSKFLQSIPLPLQKIYKESFRSKNDLLYGLIRTDQQKRLLIIGEREKLLKDPFAGHLDPLTSSFKICPLSLENTLTLMEVFPFTRPVPVLHFPTTIGFGVCLGLATPGYLRSLKHFKVRPVLAQQSLRPNDQTRSNVREVMADAAWSVFQEGYQDGYGADGDPLKSLHEVRAALDAGVSMITLDLSETVNVSALSMPKETMEQTFQQEIDPGDAKVFLHLFLDKEFLFEGDRGKFSIRFSEEEVKRSLLLFQRAIDFAEEVYQLIQHHTGRKPLIDFEISLDEMPLPFSPEMHLFLVITLRHRGVRINSLAPRFIGTFLKGIDDRGEIASFEELFYRHFLISQRYGEYKLSIPSGNDKFSVFPIIGAISQQKIHIKISKTSWLEAVRLISLKKPSLYREMHLFALSSLEEVSALDHVTIDLTHMPPLSSLSDSELPDLLLQENVRQLLQMTCDSILRSPLKIPILQTLNHYEEDYASLLDKDLQKHLDYLGAERRDKT